MNLRTSAQRSVATALLAMFLLVAGVGPEQSRAQGRGKQNFDNVKVEMQLVQGNVYLLTGAGGNTAVQAGPDGVLVVDTQFAPMVPKMLAAIRQLTDKPIRYIINTHVHGDHTGGNAALLQASPGAKIIAHENVLKVMSAPPSGRGQFQDFSAPKGNWPVRMS
jgi:glyoxylase-like metal-dependent hydrolase (beta-lactamase superfamily II)